jgi:hypothetical protein
MPTNLEPDNTVEAGVRKIRSMVWENYGVVIGRDSVDAITAGFSLRRGGPGSPVGSKRTWWLKDVQPSIHAYMTNFLRTKASLTTDGVAPSNRVVTSALAQVIREDAEAHGTNSMPRQPRPEAPMERSVPPPQTKALFIEDHGDALLEVLFDMLESGKMYRVAIKEVIV